MKPKRKTRKELEEYDRRIREVYEKRGFVPKTVYKKGWKAVFPSNSKQRSDQ